MLRKTVLGLILLVLCTPLQCIAFGTLPTDEFGLGARDTAMGMAYTALADDFTAVYYNPAGLAIVPPGVSLNFGYKAYGRQFSVPEESAEDYASLPVMGLTYRPDYTVAGWRLPAFGFAALTPLPDIRRQVDDNNPHSIRYNSQGLLPIYIGAAYQLLPRVHVGAAAAILASGTFRANAIAGGTILTPELTGLGISGPVEIGVTPHAGILLGPFDDWSFGFSYRGAQSLELDAGFSVKPDFDVSLPPPLGVIAPATFKIVTGWSPQQFAGGIAYRGFQKWSLSADLVFKRWDEWISSTGRHPDPDFRNRVVPHIGVEHWLTQSLALQGGYYFEPTPVPAQRGNTSYVDNDQHVFSLGLSYALDRFTGVRTIVAPTFQAHWLPDRTTHKVDAANPFFPGFTVGGAVLSGGIVITVYP